MDLFGTPPPAAGSLPLALPPPPRRYETILTMRELGFWLELLYSAPVFAFVQTSSADSVGMRIVGVSFCAEPGYAAYVPLAHSYIDAPAQLNAERVLELLKPLLEDPLRPKVMHDSKFDAHVLGKHGIQLDGVLFDPMIASYVLDSSAAPHDLNSVAEKYLRLKPLKIEDVCGKGRERIAVEHAPVDQVAQYCAEDADLTLQLHLALWPQISQEPKLRTVYEKIEHPLTPVLKRMESNGVLIDRRLLQQHNRELSIRLRELEHSIYCEAGLSFNIDSPKQLQDALFNRMGLPVRSWTPSGEPSTAEEALQDLVKEYWVPHLLLEYRRLSKLRSTYTGRLPAQAHPYTGRIHTSYNQAVTITGRLSSSNPNLQNIPSKSAEGRRVRRAFIAPARHVLLSADYSQIELRIMAHLSGDEGLLRAFWEGLDIHRATAADIFGVPPEEVSSDQRRYAKEINFGLLYGMSTHGLARQLGIDFEAAQAYVDLYFAGFPGVKRFIEENQAKTRERGYVETTFGRRIYLPDIDSADQQARRHAEHGATNGPMQGTSADIIKLAMIEVDHWIRKERAPVRLIMQVHDELIFEVVEDAVMHVATPLQACMMNAAQLNVPLQVDLGIGYNWDEAH